MLASNTRPMRKWASGPLLFGNQRVGRLLDAVVEEFVGVLLAEDEASADGFPESRMYRGLGRPLDQGQGGDLGEVAQAGELFQGFLRGGGQPPQLLGHQINRVIGVALRADAIDVPLPGRPGWFECEQSFVG
jgi:hypothetical protein